ncbi:hypothetical protein BOC57_34845 [Burkholderia pseudomallei]|nr:hypothetical protein BOC57_34845 [Burkholderia pseudomallei]
MPQPIGPYDVTTSAGGRGYIAEFFAKRLCRHDFGRYIDERLAADFACALAKYLMEHDTSPSADAAAAPADAQAVEPVGEAGTMPGTDGFTMAAFRADDVPVGTKLYAAPPPPAPASASVGLTDEQRKAIQVALKWVPPSVHTVQEALIELLKGDKQ